MPRGSHHDLVGILLRDRGGFALGIPGDGTWRLDLGWRTVRRARGLVGLRVRVTGTRDGYDLLAVTTIERS